MAVLKNTTINDTGSLQVESGNTSQRPSNPETGFIRFNTDNNSVEIYNGTNWVEI